MGRAVPSRPVGDAEPSDILITGLGLATPLGHSLWESARALLEGRRTADRLEKLPEGTDPVWIARATGGIGFGALAPTDPAIEIGERAAREAIADAGLADETTRDLRTVVASSKGAVVVMIQGTGRGAGDGRRDECAAMGPHGYLAHHLRRRLGVGDVSAPVAACATSAAALAEAEGLLRDGRAERVLVIGVESALLAEFVWPYHRLGVLAPIEPPTAHVGRPLDRERAGFTLGEFAAAVVLERADVAGKRDDAWGRLLSARCGTQPFDMVRAAGTFSVLERLVRAAAPDGMEIALVQPHATGTVENDERELRALEAGLGERAGGAAVYASKGAFGHPLGAAGLVNLALGCAMGRIGKIPPMPWIESPVETRLAIHADGTALRGGAHLIAAAGFGGHVGVVCYEPRGRKRARA